MNMLHQTATTKATRSHMRSFRAKRFIIWVLMFSQLTSSQAKVQLQKIHNDQTKARQRRHTQEGFIDFLPDDLFPVPIVPTDTPIDTSEAPNPTLSPAPISDMSGSAHPAEDQSRSSVPPSTTTPTVSSSPSTKAPFISSMPSERPSTSPSGVPSEAPSENPSSSPSMKPSENPSESPSTLPSGIPSEAPSESPSESPSVVPSHVPSDSPSEVPSSQPSEIPSDFPSLLPSVAPSDSAQPSTVPTNQPSSSQAPSEVPSSGPSSQPSISAHPSEQPSLQPTESTFPSFSPSDVPSNVPSVSISPSEHPSSVPTTSQVPSEAPSEIPSPSPSISPEPTVTASSAPTLSLQPSEMPSEIPSSVPSTSSFPSESPSLEPTVSAQPSISQRPSPSPTSTPSEQPSPQPSISSYPSAAPSETPSSMPSEPPSSEPSPSPSDEPSPSPSRTPSGMPSTVPSASPTHAPSSSPSTSPSTSPSESPSTTPSQSPSLTCHDIAAYRSPINDLTCADHAGTECLQWRFLGLNTTELGALINSCPESCDIQCGAFSQFSVPVSFRLSAIPGILDNSAKRTLETVAESFVLGFVEKETSGAVFELDSTEMKTQSLVEQPTRGLRRLAGSKIVDVTILFDGFALDLNQGIVSHLLVSAIEDPDFAVALQDSTEFYSTAETSSASETTQFAGTIGAEEKSRKGASSATIAVSTLISGSILFFGVGSFIYHSRSGKWVPWASEPELGDGGGPDDDICLSPSNGRSSVGLGSPRNSLLSFDTSSTTMQGPGGVVPSSTLGRLIASLSLSRSKSSTEEDNSESQDFDPVDPEYADNTPPLISPMSDETDTSGFQEHPLASIIPPMIVIDHIDEASTNEESEATRKKQQVPSKRVEASSDFLTALRGSNSNTDPNGSFVAMLYEANDLDMSTWTNGYDSARALSPIGIVVDSDTDDDTSIASTPVQSTTPKARFPLRRALSAGALENSPDRRISTDMLSPGPLGLENTHFFSPVAKDTASKGHWVDGDGHENNTVELTLGPQIPVASPLEHNVSSSGSVDFQNLPPMHPATPDRSGRVASSPSEGGILNSLWSLSPISKAFKESTPRALRRPSIPKRSEAYAKRKSSSVCSDTSEDEMPTRRSVVVAADAGATDKQIRYEFETPRKGQLGLVIEASKDGPVVRAVKDYSPLFGLVKKGDRIVEVDGKRTTTSTLTEITRLLAVRPSRRSSHLRIAVTRSVFQDNLDSQSSASPRHSRGSSYGSISEADAASDDLLRASYFSDQSAGGHGEL